MDKKKYVKEIIDYICDTVYFKYMNSDIKDDFSFLITISGEDGYLIRDKGVDKRIKKLLYKRYGDEMIIKTYIYAESLNYTEIRIRLIKNVSWKRDLKVFSLIGRVNNG